MRLLFESQNNLSEKAAKTLAALPEPIRESFLIEAVIRHAEASPIIQVSENSGVIDIQAYNEMTRQEPCQEPHHSPASKTPAHQPSQIDEPKTDGKLKVATNTRQAGNATTTANAQRGKTPSPHSNSHGAKSSLFEKY